MMANNNKTNRKSDFALLMLLLQLYLCKKIKFIKLTHTKHANRCTPCKFFCKAYKKKFSPFYECLK